MLNIFKYSMIYTFKKKSTWILLALLGLVAWGIPYSIANSIGEAAGDDPKLSVVFVNPLVAISFYIFYTVMLMSYLSVKALNIYKDGEDDGSTLLLVSKRFTRGDIVFGRFFAVILHLIFAAGVVFIGMFIADSLLDGPSGMDYVISLTVGTLIIGGVFVSFSTLLSTTVGRVGTMFISIVVAFSMVLANTLLMSVVGANKVHGENFEDIANITVGSDNTYRSVDSNHQDAKGYTTEKYRLYSKFDVWYQLSSTLLLFTDKDVILDKVDYEENSESQITSIRDDISLAFGDDTNDLEYLYLSYPAGTTYVPSDDIEWQLSFDELAQDTSKALDDKYINANDGNSGKTKLELITDMAHGAIEHHSLLGASSVPPSLYQVFDMVGELINRFDTYINDYDDIIDGSKVFDSLEHSQAYHTHDYAYNGVDIDEGYSVFDNPNLSWGNSYTYDDVVAEYLPQLLGIEVIKDLSKSEDLTVWNTVIQPDVSSSDLGRLSDNGNTHSPEFKWFSNEDFASSYLITPYISKTARVITWVVISSLMFLWTLVIYYRRDFR